MVRPHRRILVSGLLLTTALVASCASPHIDPDQPKSADRFQEILWHIAHR